ncbi:MAG: tyrosine-protein phosphatase [Treponema sp.]|nr:tyrosine-protein phosphatase [Treponema sp.]
MKRSLLAIFILVCSVFLVISCASNNNKTMPKGKTMQTSITKESQTLIMETLGNARELGGYVSQDGRKVKRGILLRSAKPINASPADLDRLKNEYHLHIITDFRMSYEREAEPNPEIDGVTNVWCPIIDEDMISANVSSPDSAKSMNTFERLKIAVDRGIVTDKMYVGFLSMDQGKKGYSAFFRQLLALPEGKSLLFHCTQGKDRTGLGAMLILSALDVDEETIMQDYLLTNIFNANLIEREKQMLSQYNLSDSEMQKYLSVMDQVDSRYMQNAIDYLKANYGSVKGYITKELGLTENDISILKDKFLY